MTVARYMALCLGHPAHGYYTTRDPFGSTGDFTTAPEISQMFGELLGLWALSVWELMGAPNIMRLVELGPGRGTLMADALRAARLRRPFLEALAVDLVETSPVLRRMQQERLCDMGVPVVWRDRLADVPPGPAIVIANEFFDALPVRQYVFTERGWCERLVGLDADERLSFGLSPRPEPSLIFDGRPDDVFEVPEAGLMVAHELGRRLASDGGAALIIDYGYEGPLAGDTLQAVRGHRFADPLEEPGEADLTAHVDFARLAAAAAGEGVNAFGPVPQGAFLRSLGIEARAASLKARANPMQAADIDSAVQRLAGTGPGKMGNLFKVLCLADPHVPAPPGFVAREGSL